MSDLLDLSEAPAKRPAFITVLCILTFVGAGIGILSGIYSLLTVQNTIETLERFNSLSKGFGVFQDTMSSQITALKKYGMLSTGMNVAGSGR